MLDDTLPRRCDRCLGPWMYMRIAPRPPGYLIQFKCILRLRRTKAEVNVSSIGLTLAFLWTQKTYFFESRLCFLRDRGAIWDIPLFFAPVVLIAACYLLSIVFDNYQNSMIPPRLWKYKNSCSLDSDIARSTGWSEAHPIVSTDAVTCVAVRGA
ncbi:hypothetical protein BV25DRAFT_1574049 [Artomyces pyxidatus]|uniref:Uncharacterized protein n=1 Tax=Artomyces pyxidatus TaxID=48021 RepID=A0ACB8SL43_9AGAM|nr:hypothetical protein BV25DRAFT_1574049 [Artomyces pyxidatus]